MRVNNNKVATRSTKGMKDGVGERAKKANPAESMGKTTLGCWVKAISLKLSTGIEVLPTEELIVSVECTLWSLMGFFNGFSLITVAHCSCVHPQSLRLRATESRA